MMFTAQGAPMLPSPPQQQPPQGSRLLGYMQPQFGNLSINEQAAAAYARQSAIASGAIAPFATSTSSDTPSNYTPPTSQYANQASINQPYYFEAGTTSTMGTADAHPSTYGRPEIAPHYVYAQDPPHLTRTRTKGAGFGTYFTPSDIKTELLQRQQVAQAVPSVNEPIQLPSQVNYLHDLCPLESVDEHGRRPFFTDVNGAPIYNYVYKATSERDASQYCLRRLSPCHINNRQLIAMDTWKKLTHTNVVQLRDVFATKAFGDDSVVFVYDYHATAETLRAKHFEQHLQQQQQPHMQFHQPANQITETLIWSYVIQLANALRTIHSAGLAAKTIDPAKILLVGKSKLLINCCGIMDVLTYEAQQGNQANMVHKEQDADMFALGRLIVALCCGTLQSAVQSNLPNSIKLVAQRFSSDLEQLLIYLVKPSASGARHKNPIDIMPMIGARFYAQLDAQQMRNDVLENELSKELQNARLFRLIVKLNRVKGGDAEVTGDQFLLQMFHDYVFQSVDENGMPWLDMAHIIQTLNKMDAASPERVQLQSTDGANNLIVSYADLNHAFSRLWATATQQSMKQPAAAPQMLQPSTYQVPSQQQPMPPPIHHSTPTTSERTVNAMQQALHDHLQQREANK